MQLVDSAGTVHTFHFATRLVDVSRMSIEAYEPHADPGYRFQVIAGSAGAPRSCISACWESPSQPAQELVRGLLSGGS